VARPTAIHHSIPLVRKTTIVVARYTRHQRPGGVESDTGERPGKVSGLQRSLLRALRGQRFCNDLCI